MLETKEALRVKIAKLERENSRLKKRARAAIMVQLGFTRFEGDLRDSEEISHLLDRWNNKRQEMLNDYGNPE